MIYLQSYTFLIDSQDRVVIFADGSDIYKIKLGGVPTKQRITSATENVTGNVCNIQLKRP